MDYKDKEIIISRFNDAVKYVVAMQQAIFDDNRPAEIEHKRNAGEALSCSYEWSVKHHLFHYANDIPQAWKDGNFDRIVRWGDLLEALKDRAKGQPFSSELPSFSKLYDDKKNGRNISTHSGEEPIEENIFSFIDELRKLILAYVDKDAELANIEEYIEYNATGWNNLYLACNKFERTDNNYVLIVGDLQSQPTPYKKYLSSLPWSLIIDFDQLSREENGFYNTCYANQAIPPKIVKVTDNLDSDFFPITPRSHFHYFIKGYKGDGILINNDIRLNVWKREYDKYFRAFISAFASKYPSSTKIVVLYEDVSFASTICGLLDIAFAERIEFLILSSSNRLNDRLQEDGFEPRHLPLSLSELSTGISLRHKEFEAENFFEDSYRLPHNKTTKTPNVDGIFTVDEIALFEEDMEVLHLDILKNIKEEDRFDFLRGKTALSWYGANLNHPFDVRHPELKTLLKDIRRDRKGIYYIKHDPGVGGTTFSRRLAWDLHDENPTVIIKDYRDGNKVLKKLEKIHKKTRERIYIIANVPQAISVDGLKELKNRLEATSWPHLIIAVGRDLSAKENSSLVNWGDECIRLITEFKNYLPELGYTSGVIAQKEQLLNDIYNGNEGYKKTPFYIGFSVLEEKFFGIESFIKNFVDSLKTPEQRKIISYLSLVQDYLGSPLPSFFFSKLLKTADSSAVVKVTDALPNGFDHILNKNEKGGITYWTTRHLLFAKRFKEQLLKGKSAEGLWKDNLPDLCLEFIEDSKLSGEQSTYIQEEILQPLFIGSRTQRGGQAFTALVEAMNPEARESVFLCLTDTFPDNPHYCSHLARFYNYTKKNTEKALKYATDAIQLCEKEGRKDPILYHIRGMCYRQSAHYKIESIRNRVTRPFDEEIDEIIYDLVPKAAREFQEARRLQKSSEYGYVAHIQMLIEAIDFGHFLSNQTKADFLSSEREPFAEWLDEAATLLEEVKRLTIGEEGSENEKVTQCDDDLNAFYERYDLVIQNLNNQLNKSKYPDRLRRQITRFMIKKQPDYSRDSRTVHRIMELMAENIKDEPEKEGNFYLWFQAARYSNLRVSEAIDKMARWKAHSNTLDAAYYFYVLKVLRAIEGYSEEMAEAVKLIQESKQKSRSIPNNTYCHEWYGVKSEMHRLVNGRDVYVGNWEDKCELVRGKITNFESDGSGKIVLYSAELLLVFFNPSETNISEDYLNGDVEFYLGFSYDGLRAKNVQPLGTTNKKRSFTFSYALNTIESVTKIQVLPETNSKIKEDRNVEVSKDKKNKQSIVTKKLQKIESNSLSPNYKGTIKVRNFNDGYIKCNELDKDVAFGRIQLLGCEITDIQVGTEVYFTIKIHNGKMQTNEKGTNYKAQEVRLRECSLNCVSRILLEAM